MDTPFISIIMPAFNSEQYIEHAMRSVMAQSFRNWELLVVDNGSTDRSRSIAMHLAEQDPRIRVLTENRLHSVAVARRWGLDNAKGEWVAFLDSDDTWSPEKLAIQLETAQQQNCPFVFTASAFMDHSGCSLGYILNVPDQITYPEILKQDIISCSSVLIRRELLQDCFHETSNDLSDDFSAWIRVLQSNCHHAVGIDLPLLTYRISRTSLSKNKFRSALCTFRTYRHCGLSFAKALWYWFHYIIRSLRKYSGLYIAKIYRTNK